MVSEVAKTEGDYEIENAARALLEAEKIKRDKKLYPAAMKELKKQQVALSQALGAGKSLMRVLSNKEEE